MSTKRVWGIGPRWHQQSADSRPPCRARARPLRRNPRDQGVDNVDPRVVVGDGGVFGQDGDTALTLQIVGVHDARGHGFVVTEDARLSQQRDDQGGLAKADEGDDRDAAHRLLLGAHAVESFEIVKNARGAVRQAIST